jgi:hypothetical protein
MKITPHFAEISTKINTIMQQNTLRSRMLSQNNHIRSDEGNIYRVTIKGIVDKDMKDWFDGMDVQQKDETTILEGKMIDQSELQGLLRKIHDLHLTLVSVETIT